VERTSPERALIIAGGHPISRAVADRLERPAFIVAADSGLDRAYELGLRPDVVVGDMDSVTEASLARAEAEGITIERHPTDKDATDLELAVATVGRRGFLHATIIGGTGGRFAHTLANALLLTRSGEVRLDWLTSHARITALESSETRTFPAADGPLLSVLAIGGAARCSSSGLRWPLDEVPLTPGVTRGISNEIVGRAASLTVDEGCILVVHERNNHR
jgi:thiamine pyrophosphokinase